MTATSLERLSTEKIAVLLRDDGPFSLLLANYEGREEQRKMLTDVVRAYNKDEIALVEAGTGTGKSVAYLLPALAWAIKVQERTLISTHTITLQEQLLNKDIPLVSQALGIDVKAVLVKGMNNYLCMRKLEEATMERLLLVDNEGHELDRIEEWSHSTTDGTRATLPFVPSLATWERVGAESDTCTAKRCPHYEKCHFFKARREAEDAQILISNHHLLFADLANDKAILPPYSRIIIDEAHHIEDVASEYFAGKASLLNMLHVVGRLAAEKGGKAQGKLPQLKMRIIDHFRECDPPTAFSKVISHIEIELPSLRHDLLKHIVDTFEVFEQFVAHAVPEEGNKKMRLRPEHLTHPLWLEEVVPHVDSLIHITSRYVAILKSIDQTFKEEEDAKLNEMTHGIRQEIAAMASRLQQMCLTLSHMIEPQIPDNQVRWIESNQLKSMVNTHLNDAQLDISDLLAEKLFEPHSSVILCSATLTTNRDFSFIRRRYGLTDTQLPDRAITESIYDSPFNYQQQTLFAIPSDMPAPDHPDFLKTACRAILDAIQASKGNAFVLFTSYSMMRKCTQMIGPELHKKKFPLFKQGDSNRQNLLDQFKKTHRAVLFGTDSFWEGVDVVGEDLRCVILVKLPFKVPSEPIIEARTESIMKNGGDPFKEYSLPSAIVKFKQGYGRLIRNKHDRGCIVCLDSRILNRSYGKVFRNSLPPSAQWVGLTKDLQKVLGMFYFKTVPK